MAFVPRAAFAYPAKTASWYAGHMARSMRLMGDLLPDVDLVIEARDARLPLTSINGAFDDLLAQSWGPIWNGPDGGAASGSMDMGSTGRVAENLVGGKVDRKGKMREKIIAYTKRDLAEAKYEEPLIKAFRDRLDQRVLFIDNRNDEDVKQLLKIAVNAARENPDLNHKDPLRVLVVGMPNVGKSSLLNALRRVGTKRGKHFKTSSMPGMTRKLAGVVKIYEDPLVYVHDSPGVMVPFLGHGDLGAERGLKFALTAGIKESLFESEVAVDYLLWRMNQRIAMEQHLPPEERNPTYIDVLPLPPTFTQPTEDLYTLIDPLCTKIGALAKGSQPDYNAAFAFVQKFFREGKLGRWTIDDLAPLGASGEELDWRVWQSVGQYLEQLEVQKMEAERGEGLSGAQQRKKEKQEKEEKRIAKYQRMKAERGASFTRLRQKAAAARFSKRR